MPKTQSFKILKETKPKPIFPEKTSPPKEDLKPTNKPEEEINEEDSDKTGYF